MASLGASWNRDAHLDYGATSAARWATNEIWSTPAVTGVAGGAAVTVVFTALKQPDNGQLTLYEIQNMLAVSPLDKESLIDGLIPVGGIINPPSEVPSRANEFFLCTAAAFPLTWSSASAPAGWTPAMGGTDQGCAYYIADDSAAHTQAFSGTHGANNTYVTGTVVYEPMGPVTNPPVVSGVSPQWGTTAGGTGVTITGSAFTGASAVAFGATAATSYTVDSDGQITAIAPAHVAGTVDVTVTVGSNTSATSAADYFTFEARPAGKGFSSGIGFSSRDTFASTDTFKSA